MAQIYVKSDRMAACGVQYGKHAKQLAAAEDAIRAVRKKLDSALWEKAGVKQRLKKAADACDDGWKNSGKLQLALVAATAAYRKCENDILGYEEKQKKQEALEEKHSDILEFAKDPKSSLLFSKFILDTEVLKDLGLDDAILVTINNGFGLGILIDKIQGKDYETEVVKKNLAEILQNMEKRSGEFEVTEEVKLVVEALEKGGELSSDLMEKYGDIIEGLGDVGDLLKYGEKGVSYLQYLLTDYSESLETLEMLKGIGTDGSTGAAVDQLIAEYQDKYIGSLDKAKGFAMDFLMEEGSELAFDAATGGLYSLINLGTDVALELSGLSDRADATEALMGNTIIEADIYSSYLSSLDALQSGDLTEADVANAQRMFDMQKAIKIAQYENVLDIAKSKASDSVIEAIEKELELIKSLEMNTESINKVDNYRGITTIAGGSTTTRGSSGRGHGGGGRRV